MVNNVHIISASISSRVEPETTEMATHRGELTSLFNQIDDWFTDVSLDEPISHFCLEEDRVKLGVIARTTLSWFKILTNPLTPQKDDYESSDLDCLAKDLEQLLEEDNTKPIESEFHYFTYYPDESRALLDESIGHCCEVRSKSNKFASNNSKARSNHIQVTQGTTCQVSPKKQTSSQSTPTPQDHDYLFKPTPTNLALNNQMIQEVRNKVSVLNTDALRKFARFSQRFRILSIEQDNARRIAECPTQ